VKQPRGDLYDHLSANLNLRDRIENNREEHHVSEMQRRREYDEAHGAPGHGYAPHAGHIPSLWSFTDRLRAIIWPRNFKVHDLDTYDGKANLEQWITLYEITVRATHGDEDVMANYFPMVINQSMNQWLLSLREGSIDT
jgi:hypothetical protein